jgi:exopolyphosphatase/guanosine-5'-triphosphate,3'-diphosphate pyrophosphatase
MKQAIIDLGTNTFHLLIAEKQANGYQTLFRESHPAKIGQAGINQGVITEAGINRALRVLTYFRTVLNQYQVPQEQILATGTSAIRVARNQQEFIDRVWAATKIPIRVISGDQEAEYIYHGVWAAGTLDDQTSLIVDIGGGSVEFILGNQHRIFWKQSFEIGGQRLRERFMPERPDHRTPDRDEPISPGNVRKLQNYLQEQLLPLANAIHQYQPTTLVGSSGSFDTLVDMWYMHKHGQLPDPNETTFTLPLAEFYRSYELLLTRNHAERMQLPGMIKLRVDMIVVAVCLIDFILKTYGIQHIKTSTYSLKEGILSTMSQD